MGSFGLAMCRCAQWRNIWANEPQTSAWYEKEQQWLLNPNEGHNIDVNSMFNFFHVIIHMTRACLVQDA